jgi:exosortase A
MSAESTGIGGMSGFAMSEIAGSGSGRIAAIAGGAVALAIVFLFFDTARSTAAIWQSSETFSHGFLVVPITLWLIWRRRDRLMQVPPEPFWPALLLVAGGGFGWLLGRLAGAAVVEQFALVFMIQGAVLSVLGWRMARALAFPLLFLLFAVPFGEALVPRLIDWTADFTVLALKVTGIPVYREGNSFVIPSGQWSVVEACSGIRYLIASLTAGALYAHLMYTTRWRQAAFIAASILVPILANWLRAYFIVMIGHLSGNELAVGIDHLIYGWVFFGIVIALMFWVGARFREPRAVPTHAAADAAAVRAVPASAVAAALGAILIAGLWVPLGATLADASDDRPRFLQPIAAENGWQPAHDSFDWRPRFSGERASLRQAFERDGARVFVHVSYYAGQNRQASLINSTNVLVALNDTRWRELARGSNTVAAAGETLRMRTTSIADPAGRFDVYWTYWVDGRFTTSDAVGKLLTALARLQGRADDSAVVFLFTNPSERREGAAVLARFAADMAQSIERVLAAARDGAAP